MAEYSTYSDFYKVSFVTTSSPNIPQLLKETGGLIVLSDTEGKDCMINPDHGTHHPQQLWFRGNMIASGYGAYCEDERDQLTYLANTYNALFKGIDEQFDSNANWINAYNAYFLNAYSYTIDTIGRVKDESYTYTNSQIDRLVGGAPEYLDSLAEIAYWLQHDQEMGLDAFMSIEEIHNSYITHESIDENGYVYLSATAWESKKSDTPTSGTRMDYDTKTGKWTEVPYEYYEYERVPAGTVALKDEQVSTHFKDAQLSEVLDCLVDPYPYTTPDVSVVNYDFYTSDETGYAEPSETIVYNISCKYNVNDAESLTNITLMKDSSKIVSEDVSFSEQESGVVTLNGQIKVQNPGDNIVFNKVAWSYDASPVKYYPQLEKLEIEDTDHVFEAGKATIEETCAITACWKAFAKAGNNVTIPTTAAALANADYAWIDNDERVELTTMSLSDNSAWIALPAEYNPDNFIVYIENKQTSIRQPINKLNDGNIITFELVNTITNYKSTNMNYNVYSLVNKSFNMANEYILVIENLND